MSGLFYPYGIILQAIAILHFARRRPNTFWIWIIIMGGGLGEIALGDFPAAAADLDEVVKRDAKYDYHRAAGLLAHALGKVGQRERASALFAQVTQISTLSETQYNYACFLADEKRTSEA